MARYLLLRDNKESGPHNVDDLVKLGLKAYDLVWIEGRSAAWRYPSEIEELKPFSPVAEEQPFDRFFKKPADELKEELPVKNQTAEQQYAPVPQVDEPAFMPKKSVFVTLPGGQKSNIAEHPRKEQTKQQEPATPIQPVKKTPPPARPVTVEEDVPEVAEIKYSQPLDEIKEMYVKTLQQRKNRIARKGFLMASMKKAAVIGGLIGLGILTGFIIKSKPGGASTAVTQQPTTASPAFTNNLDADETEASIGREDEAINNQPKAGKMERRIMPEDSGDQLRSGQKPVLKIRKETMITPKESKQFDDQQVSPGVGVDPLSGERTRAVRNNDTDTEPKAVLKAGNKGLSELVSVSSNDYKIVAFGGIRNLELTVTNNSKYELDNVIVELQYLKPSEEPLRTENLRFKSIAPNHSSTLKVPDTNRGIKIVYRIINIESRQNADDVAGM